MELVSAVIPTYNRFSFLLNTLKSIKNQTYKNIEIIVVNDASTDKEYYKYNWKKENIKIIHLKENSKEKIGFPCAGYVRNQGIKEAKGKYIAFCDDDDIWLPKKIEIQMNEIKKTDVKMCSTDGLIGDGVYDPSKTYKKMNAEYHFMAHKKKYNDKKINFTDFPKFWDYDFICVSNGIICSSVLIEKDLLKKIKMMDHIRNKEDLGCWKKALKFTKNLYIKDICFYYDKCHGKGKNY